MSMKSLLEKVVSGGQTGVDRAALDAAVEADIAIGGWCPRGRLAEDGPIPNAYPLVETPSDAYEQRTAWNVRDADATLILTIGEPTGGTAYTRTVALRMRRPALTIDLDTNPTIDDALAFIAECGARVLNVAGPRESKAADVYARALAFCCRLFRALAPNDDNPRHGADGS